MSDFHNGVMSSFDSYTSNDQYWGIGPAFFGQAVDITVPGGRNGGRAAYWDRANWCLGRWWYGQTDVRPLTNRTGIWVKAGAGGNMPSGGLPLWGLTDVIDDYNSPPPSTPYTGRYLVLGDAGVLEIWHLTTSWTKEADSGTYAVPYNKWAAVEVYSTYDFGTGDWVWSVAADGVEVISATTYNTTASYYGWILGPWTTASGSSAHVNLWIDDWYHTWYPGGPYYGAWVVEPLRPVGAGHHSDWSGSYLQVQDPYEPDGSGTTINAGALNQVSTFLMSATRQTSGTLKAAQVSYLFAHQQFDQPVDGVYENPSGGAVVVLPASTFTRPIYQDADGIYVCAQGLIYDDSWTLATFATFYAGVKSTRAFPVTQELVEILVTSPVPKRLKFGVEMIG